MASITPPYFLDEFLRPVNREAPTERERALGLTLSDLDWMHTLYYATDHARRDPQMRKTPMTVEMLLIDIAGKSAVPLAGAFTMSPSPEANKALLYTPYGGIEVFDNREALFHTLINLLNNATQRIDIIKFLSIEQRQKFPLGTVFTLKTAPLDGAVFEDQAHLINANQRLNAQAMLAQLLQTPELSEMLDKALSSMAGVALAGLDHNDTHVESRTQQPNAPAGSLGTMQLREVLLQFYLDQSWPVGQSRTFLNPRHVTFGFNEAQRDQDRRHWERLIEQTAGVLFNLLNSQLKSWWNQDIGGGQSRLTFFAQVIGEKFRADLLLKHQAGVLSAEESYYARTIFVSQRHARFALRPSMTIDKVRIHAPLQQYMDLASILLIRDTHAYLYTQTRGLQRLDDTYDLSQTPLSMLKAPGHEDELLNYLSIEERSVFISMENMQISGVPVTGDVFEELVGDVMDKQSSNMENALSIFRRSEGRVDLASLLDCELDVRAMLDSQLLDLDTGGRWSLHPVRSEDGRPSTVRAESAKRELKVLQAANAVVTEQRARHPTLRSLVAQALNQQLQQQTLDVDADKVYINTYSTAAKQLEERVPESSISLVDHFIERLAHAGSPVLDTLRIGFYSAPEAGVAVRQNNLSSAAFNRLVERAMSPFANYDVRTLPIQFLDNHREQLSAALLQGLRSEADLRELNGTLSPNSRSILDTVLREDSMTRVKRHGLRGFLPDAYGLTVKVGDDESAHALANCFVLTERGGVDIVRSGQALLWTPQRGHESFKSLRALRDTLELRLGMPEEQLALLDNLPVRIRAPHQTFHPGPLLRIDDHILNNRQQSYVVCLLGGIDYWCAASLSPTELQNCLDIEMQRMAPSNLERAMAIAQGIIHQQGLPTWLGMAAPQDQRKHAELLQQYLNSAPDQRDYLHGVPSLRGHVAGRLLALLDKRFPGQALNPDDIQIPMPMALNGQALSLTDYALLHLPDLPSARISPTSRTATPLPPTLDGTAVVQMILQLDTADTYRALLSSLLKSASQDTRQRKVLFSKQLPWQALRLAHEEKLAHRLSATAWNLVLQVFDMPDAVAREKVEGTTAQIRPLELIASDDATPVKVLGVYLINPKPPHFGPVVLYMPYRPQYVFKEYAQEAEVLEEIKRPGELQDWVLRHMDAAHQATYQSLWKSSQPGGGTMDVDLGSSPVRGNVLTRMFEDNAQQLIEMLASQFDAGGKNQWEAFTDLLNEGISTGSRFIAGKLNYPWEVWHSFKLFHTSAEHLQQQRWTQGLKTFVQGLAGMASLRTAMGVLDTPESSSTTDASTATRPTPVVPTTLDTMNVTQSLRTRLQRFENADVALEDLHQSPLTHVYSAGSGNRYYVPVAGKVYPVTQAGERWRISQEEVVGPYVQLDTGSKWVLDLTDYHPRFGPAWSREIPRSTERDEINIEATGMHDIAALSPWKARCITEAINVATYYAVNCKRNILAFAGSRPPGSRVGKFLTGMFGVMSFSPMQLQKIQHRIDEVLGELVNPTLMRPDSRRFVVGTARWESLETYDFTLPEDLEKKIYLLNRFFDPLLDVYENRLNAPFDITAHARATVLLHEVSHLICHTEDIAYMDSMRPFHDLINVNAPQGQAMFTALFDVRETALSVMTPASQLFKTWDWITQRWEDLGEYGSSHVHDHVLKVTGTATLDGARQVFMSDPNKRMDVILTNADSVAYMIAQLGRVLDPGA